MAFDVEITVLVALCVLHSSDSASVRIGLQDDLVEFGKSVTITCNLTLEEGQLLERLQFSRKDPKWGIYLQIGVFSPSLSSLVTDFDLKERVVLSHERDVAFLEITRFHEEFEGFYNCSATFKLNNTTILTTDDVIYVPPKEFPPSTSAVPSDVTEITTTPTWMLGSSIQTATSDASQMPSQMNTATEGQTSMVLSSASSIIVTSSETSVSPQSTLAWFSSSSSSVISLSWPMSSPSQMSLSLTSISSSVSPLSSSSSSSSSSSLTSTQLILPSTSEATSLSSVTTSLSQNTTNKTITSAVTPQSVSNFSLSASLSEQISATPTMIHHTSITSPTVSSQPLPQHSSLYISPSLTTVVAAESSLSATSTSVPYSPSSSVYSLPSKLYSLTPMSSSGTTSSSGKTSSSGTTSSGTTLSSGTTTSLLSLSALLLPSSTKSSFSSVPSTNSLVLLPTTSSLSFSIIHTSGTIFFTSATSTESTQSGISAASTILDTSVTLTLYSDSAEIYSQSSNLTLSDVLYASTTQSTPLTWFSNTSSDHVSSDLPSIQSETLAQSHSNTQVRTLSSVPHLPSSETTVLFQTTEDETHRIFSRSTPVSDVVSTSSVSHFLPSENTAFFHTAEYETGNMSSRLASVSDVDSSSYEFTSTKIVMIDSEPTFTINTTPLMEYTFTADVLTELKSSEVTLTTFVPTVVSGTDVSQRLSSFVIWTSETAAVPVITNSVSHDREISDISKPNQSELFPSETIRVDATSSVSSSWALSSSLWLLLSSSQSSIVLLPSESSSTKIKSSFFDPTASSQLDTSSSSTFFSTTTDVTQISLSSISASRTSVLQTVTYVSVNHTPATITGSPLLIQSLSEMAESSTDILSFQSTNNTLYEPSPFASGSEQSSKKLSITAAMEHISSTVTTLWEADNWSLVSAYSSFTATSSSVDGVYTSTKARGSGSDDSSAADDLTLNPSFSLMSDNPTSMLNVHTSYFSDLQSDFLQVSFVQTSSSSSSPSLPLLSLKTSSLSSISVASSSPVRLSLSSSSSSSPPSPYSISSLPVISTVTSQPPTLVLSSASPITSGSATPSPLSLPVSLSPVTSSSLSLPLSSSSAAAAASPSSSLITSKPPSLPISLSQVTSSSPSLSSSSSSSTTTTTLAFLVSTLTVTSSSPSLPLPPPTDFLSAASSTLSVSLRSTWTSNMFSLSTLHTETVLPTSSEHSTTTSSGDVVSVEHSASSSLDFSSSLTSKVSQTTTQSVLSTHMPLPSTRVTSLAPAKEPVMKWVLVALGCLIAIGIVVVGVVIWYRKTHDLPLIPWHYIFVPNRGCRNPTPSV